MLLLSLIRPLDVTLAVLKFIPALFVLLMVKDNVPIAETSLGLVRGSAMVSANGRKFLAFRGVPYAKAPIGDLRFQDPVEAEPWDGVLDATKEGPVCLHYDSIFSKVKGKEDCLTLNIYTHTVNPNAGKRPVMVFIHGGGWSEGTSNGQTFLYGPKYFMDRDVILVTINYRLGPFGFLSTADVVAPGNYGLLDQSMALRWVKNNIEAFGGDSELITVFGNSAGGVSVEYHLLSPRSQGLFSKAIMQSGSTLCFWSSLTTVQVYTRRLAAYFNCPVSSSRALVDCLRGQDGHQIAHYRSLLHITLLWPVPFGPRVDVERAQPFLPQPPEQILRSGRFSKVPVIMGVNQNEGSFLVAELLAYKNKRFDRFENDFLDNLPLVFGQEYQRNGGQKSYSAFKRYFGKLHYPSQDVHLFERMISDSSFFVCVQNSVRYHSWYNNAVYAYWYTHRDSLTTPLLVGVPRSSIDFGVSHLDEVLALFRVPFLSALLRDDNDLRMTEIMLDYWTSFAATGVPQSHLSWSQWLPYTRKTPRYMELQRNPLCMNGSYPFSSRMPFWENFFSQA